MNNKGRRKGTGRFGPPSKVGHFRSSSAQSESKSTLIDFSSLSPNQQNAIKKLLDSFDLEGQVLGVVRSPGQIYSPVIHNLSDREPLLIRKLNNFNLSQDELSKTVRANQQIFSNLNSYDLIFNEKDNFTLQKRTYALNTLQDALGSTITIKLSEVLFALKQTILRLKGAHQLELFHGHVHPGNICFKMEMSGDLLDAGLLKFRLPQDQKAYAEDIFLAPEAKTGQISAASDVYGLAATLKEVLNNPTIICNDEEPSRVEVLAVLGPIIEGGMKESSKDRISLDAFSSIYFDFLPLFIKGEESVGTESETNKITNVSNSEPTKISQSTVEAKELSLDTSDEEVSSDEPSFEAMLEDIGQSVNENGDYRKDSSESTHSKQNYRLESSRQSSYLNHFFPRMVQGLFFLTLLVLIFVLGSKVLKNFGVMTSNLESSQLEDEFSGRILGHEDLESAWHSGIASQMKLVADQAVYKNVGRVLAERVILGSVMNNTLNSDLIDSSLLRVAFNPKWEEKLTEDDRRYALAVGLIQILHNQLPRDLGKLEEKNPAILLAIMSSGSSGVSEFLNNLPISLLEKLPVPYGPAFQLLSIEKPGKTSGDLDVLTLARLGTRGVESPVALRQFLGDDFKRRLSALAVLYSSQPANARKVLDIIVEHPNLSLNNLEVTWAKKVGLMDWKEIDSSDQLFLLAGVPLRGNSNLSATSTAKLFLNPSAAVRGYAAGLAIDKIQFLHKGAPEILNMVHRAPDMLSQDQFVMLGQILEDPKRTAETHRKIVHAFIASNPPIEIAKHLLLASSKEDSPTILDTALGIYLGEQGFKPSQEEIAILSKHPDKVSRMFAYQSALSIMKKEEALEFLKKSHTSEPDTEYKERLREMIAKLSN